MSILIQGSHPHLLPTSVVILITPVLAIWLIGALPLRLLMMAVCVLHLISCVYRRDCDFRGLCQVHARFTWGLYVGFWVSDLSQVLLTIYYSWEFATSLDFDYQFLTGKKSFRWPLVSELLLLIHFTYSWPDFLFRRSICPAFYANRNVSQRNMALIVKLISH